MLLPHSRGAPTEIGAVGSEGFEPPKSSDN